MNLIEKLGGYEKAKYYSGFQDNFNINPETKEIKYDNYSSTLSEFIGFCSVFEIRSALKDFEMKSVKFKERDNVVLNIGSCNSIAMVCHGKNDIKVHVIHNGVFKTFNPHDVRHATPEEIKAGHRL